MGTIEWIVVVGGVAVTLAAVVYFFRGRLAERADSHAQGRPFEDESGRGEPPAQVRERPAGPGAESQRPEGWGTTRSGPSAFVLPGRHRSGSERAGPLGRRPPGSATRRPSPVDP